MFAAIFNKISEVTQGWGAGTSDAPATRYIAKTASFHELDTDALMIALKIEEKGAEYGEKNYPGSDTSRLSDVELEITSLIQQEKARAQTTFALGHEAIKTSAAAASKDLEGVIIEDVFQTTEADFEKIGTEASDELHNQADIIAQAKQDIATFKDENRLNRDASIPSNRMLFWGIIAVFFLIEAIVNAAILSRVMGIVFALVTTMTIAFINVAVGGLIGQFPMRWIFHISRTLKLAGVALILSGSAFIVGFNLFVAHFRSVASEFQTLSLEEATAEQFTSMLNFGGIAFQNFISNPIGIESFESWIMFIVGCLFALIAAIDIFFMTDRYPGYGRLVEHLRGANRKYAELRAHFLEVLEHCRDNALATVRRNKRIMPILIDRLQSLKAEYTRLSAEFLAHTEYLERICNALLQKFRGANTRARSEPPPNYFESDWEIGQEKLEANIEPAELIIDVEFVKKARNDADQLDDKIADFSTKINASYKMAIERVKSIRAVRQDDE